MVFLFFFSVAVGNRNFLLHLWRSSDLIRKLKFPLLSYFKFNARRRKHTVEQDGVFFLFFFLTYMGVLTS